MNDFKLREEICEIGRRLYDKGFAAANDGNISVRLGPNRFLCTPTGVSKGFLKPDDLCIVDKEGKQISGTKKRTSEIFLHLAIFNARPEIGGVLHCHPPHATAFAIAHEPIPKCVLPEVEVFLGEVPIAVYETPGTQRFADTVLPFVHDSHMAILANHGTVAYSKDIMTAYFNTEILDAYCRMLLLARQLGPVNYLNEKDVGDLMEFKRRLGIDDPRLHMPNCDLCGNSIFRAGYADYVPEPKAFPAPQRSNTCSGLSPRIDRAATVNDVPGQVAAESSNGNGSSRNGHASAGAKDTASQNGDGHSESRPWPQNTTGPSQQRSTSPAGNGQPDFDMERLIQEITDRVLAAVA